METKAAVAMDFGGDRVMEAKKDTKDAAGGERSNGGRDHGRAAGKGRGRTGSTDYGPPKQLEEANYASVECTRCLCYGHLATAFPRRPVPEVHMVEVFNSNLGEVCENYTCNAWKSTDNPRRVTIIDSGCSAHMFSDWRVFRNFRIKTGIDVSMESLSKPLGWAMMAF